MGPILPLGSMIEYHPIPAKEQTKLHQFAKKGPLRHPRRLCDVCGRETGKDMLLADIEKPKASEIYARRLNAKEALPPKKGDEFKIPCSHGTVKLACGKVKKSEHSSLFQTFPIREKNIVMSFKEKRMCLIQQNNLKGRMTSPGR